MNYKEELLKRKEAFQIKLDTQTEEQDYYEMLSAFTGGLVELAEKAEKLKNETNLKQQLKVYDNTWHEIMDELCEALQMLEEESFKAVKGKKIYESVDEMVADLEDWIEMLNEAIENEEPLPYIEAWDIGVFF